MPVKTERIPLSFGMLMGLLLVLAIPASFGSEVGGVVAMDAIQPHVAVDHDGVIYVVFIHQGNICVSVSKGDGKHFSQPVIAIDVNGRARGGMQRGPRIGVDAQKHLTVTAPVTFDDAEYEKKYPTADLYLTTSDDGGKTWREPIRVNTIPKQAPEALHWMVVAPTGEAHVTWLDRRSRHGRGQDIYYTTVADGNVGENIQIGSTVCECCAPGLAVDGGGNPLVAFREGGDKESREIFVTGSADGGRSWHAATQINQGNSKEHGCPMSAPAVAVSPDGKQFAAAWKDVRTGEAKVYWSTSDRPRFFSDAPVHQTFRGEQNHPSIAIDASGTVWMAWEESQPGSQRIWLRSSAGEDTGRPISDPSEGWASFPVVACNAGRVAVVYETDKSGDSAVMFRSMASARE
ncbi:MAG: sialidase family protein [Candidatus Poribacteria bacterium]|nr:sialidase family protein [Candidatus Poribacteria bacterium]